MAEATISSAVALPDPEEPAPRTPPKSPTLKRRQSSVSEHDNKRPRVSTDSTVENDTSELPSATSPSRPTERRRPGATEERTRNKRLFGGLLGHLSQASPSSAQKRRADIEQKQQTKLKLQAEEREEEARKKKDGLLVLKQRQQKIYDYQAMRTRHSNLLNMANFLKTKSVPTLYYKPWDPISSEEERIKSQIEDAQATIEHELKELSERTGPEEEKTPAIEEPSTSATEPGKEFSREGDTVGSDTNSATAPEPLKDDPTNLGSASASNDVHNRTEAAEVSKGQDDDHAGDVMVEDQEDTVIY